MREYTTNYVRAGGREDFSRYYRTAHEAVRFRDEIRRNVVFSQHNLVTDRSFADFHVILCRNVMIYFDRTLQRKVHALFHESLVRFGILGLGSKETLRFSGYEDRYAVLDAKHKLFRRKA